MRRLRHNGLHYLQFESMSGLAGLRHGIFTRLGGVSEGPYASLNVGSTVGDALDRVTENRERMAAALGVRDDEVRITWQVHGADVAVLRRGDPQVWPPRQADAVVTADAGLPLAMRFADCVPVLLYDPARRVLGLAHAGWRGTVERAAAAAVETMRDAFGSRPGDVIAGIGPSIGPDVYEVGPEVVQTLRAAFAEADTLLQPSGRDGHAYFDLWESNRRILTEAGVQQIEVAGMCTFTNTADFFSHRAEGGRTGRFGMLAVIGDGG